MGSFFSTDVDLLFAASPPSGGYQPPPGGWAQPPKFAPTAWPSNAGSKVPVTGKLGNHITETLDVFLATRGC